MPNLIDKYQIDMCRGPLFSKVVLYSVPLILTGILNLLFNVTDMVVIGRFASGESMGAIGSTLSLCGLIVNVFMGLSVGTNVLVARFFGARAGRKISDAVHTAIAMAILGGIVIGLFGYFVAEPILRIMNTGELLDRAARYMKIISLGIPFVMLFNFGNAILGATGDTRRPMFYLIAAGIVNVLLNLLFVICFRMDVAGVALGTIISQGVSAFLILRNLTLRRDNCRLRWKLLRIKWPILKDMLWIGLPAGVQGAFFSLSNVTIQASVNTFGASATSGNAAALNLESIVYVGSFAYHQTALTFVSQNYGAGHFFRIRQSIFYCFLCSFLITGVMGWSFFLAGHQLLGIFNTDPAIIEWGMHRLKVLLTTYILCGAMDVVSGSMKGLGYPIVSACTVMIGVCVLRIFWVFCIFPLDRTIGNLMVSYPVSWGLTAAVNGTFLFFICRRILSSKGHKYVLVRSKRFRFLFGPGRTF